jgi:membrane protein involved in D-alanine export
MVPFDGFAYFAVLLFVLPVAVALRLLAPTARAAILAATIVMVAIQYGGTGPMAGGALVGMSATVAAYALYQSLLVSVLAWLARRRRPIARGHRAGRPPRAASYAAITLAILPLVVVKFRPALDAAIGFLGLSYVTFRSLDVLFSIRDGTLDEVSPTEFLAFLFCFPTISAGPIDRYRRFAVDWRRPRDRAALVSDLDAGVHKLFTGFFYKFILAALISERWMRPALHHHGAGAVLSYMYAYSFYLFFDFAGYSAFAIGVSYVLGVHAPENFRRPFLARNIREFWDRWHISLSWWFRDHVYMRFLLLATKRRWFTSRYLASYTGLVLSFGLMGVWHGPQLRYILYGLYHASLLIGHDVYKRIAPQAAGREPSWRSDAWATALTFHAVCFGFLLFSGRLIS